MNEIRALVALLAGVLVTVWSRRATRTRYRHIGYVHDSTIRATGWNGVPVHQHDESKLTPGHRALYEAASR